MAPPSFFLPRFAKGLFTKGVSDQHFVEWFLRSV